MEILLGILLIITIAAVIVAVVAIFYDGVGSLLWFAIAFVIFFIYSSSYSAYYTTYESSIETAIVTDKEDGKLYFQGTYCGSVYVSDAEYAVVQEGDEIHIVVTQSYLEGEKGSTNYTFKEKIENNKFKEDLK